MNIPLHKKISIVLDASFAVCLGALAMCTSLTSDNGFLPRDGSKPMAIPSFVSHTAAVSHSIGRLRSSDDTVRIGIKDTAPDMECFADNPLLGVIRDSTVVSVFINDSIRRIASDTTIPASILLKLPGKTVDSCRITIRVTLLNPSFALDSAPIFHKAGHPSSADTVRVKINDTLPGMTFLSDNTLVGVSRNSDSVSVFITDSIKRIMVNTTINAFITLQSGTKTVDSCKITVTVTVIKPSFAEHSAIITHIAGQTSNADTVNSGINGPLPGMIFTTDCPWLSADTTSEGVTISFSDPSQTLKSDTAGSVYLEFNSEKIDSIKVTVKVIVCPDDRMKLIPASGKTFNMGSNDTLDFASPVHAVTLTRNYWMDSTEVTLRQYRSVMPKSPSLNTTQLEHPIDNVTWYDAVLYCNARSKKVGLDTVYSYSTVTGTPGNGCTYLDNLVMHYEKNGFRLPTEAEWEFACRASTSTVYYWGDEISGNYCWYAQSTANNVAQFKSNAFGLYDMSGNIREWTNDASRNYSANAVTDPVFPPTSGNPVCIIRGGSWKDDAVSARSAYRAELDPSLSDNSYGFRCVAPAGN